MAKILAVGIATLDIINTVAQFPEENDEVRALSQTHQRGGNATNTLVVLSQQQHECYWAGTLAKEPDSRYILEDLEQKHISVRHVRTLIEGKVPTSYVTLNQLNGSRTIIHHRDLPEYQFSDFKNINLAEFDWVHFEGRNVEETELMLKHLKNKYPQVKCSLEIEKNRAQIERLYPHPDLIMFSRAFIKLQGFDSAARFFESLDAATRRKDTCCGWGEEGAFAWINQQLLHQPAFHPETVIDTLGAGDTFNAGIIHGSLQDWDWQRRLTVATRLAGIKCGQSGFGNLAYESV